MPGAGDIRGNASQFAASQSEACRYSGTTAVPQANTSGSRSRRCGSVRRVVPVKREPRAFNWPLDVIKRSKGDGENFRL